MILNVFYFSEPMHLDLKIYKEEKAIFPLQRDSSLLPSSWKKTGLVKAQPRKHDATMSVFSFNSKPSQRWIPDLRVTLRLLCTGLWNTRNTIWAETVNFQAEVLTAAIEMVFSSDLSSPVNLSSSHCTYVRLFTRKSKDPQFIRNSSFLGQKM